MSFTRRERAIIEDMIKRLDNLENRFDSLEKDLNTISNFVETVNKKKTIGDLSTNELIDMIRAAVEKIASRTRIKIHTHEDNNQGGDAFAKLGATLIEEDNLENQPPETP